MGHKISLECVSIISYVLLKNFKRQNLYLLLLMKQVEIRDSWHSTLALKSTQKSFHLFVCVDTTKAKFSSALTRDSILSYSKDMILNC